MPRHFGHKSGLEATRRVIQACVDMKIEALTLFAFSSENWRRPKKEVGLLMDLFLSALQKEINNLHDNDVSIRFIGDISAFSDKLQDQIRQSEQLTERNAGLVLSVAVNYGGRWDIANAARMIAEKVKASELECVEITPELFAQHVSLAGLPEPDLFIRTGGEKRISNFLLWQLAYTELYFSDALWPDFDAEAFQGALDSYAHRQRRFGKTGDQVENFKENA